MQPVSDAQDDGDVQSEVEQEYSDEVMEKAENGDAEAQNNLGSMYFHGKGVELDYKKAVEWYIRSAEQGWCFFDARKEVTRHGRRQNSRNYSRDRR